MTNTSHLTAERAAAIVRGSDAEFHPVQPEAGFGSEPILDLSAFTWLDDNAAQCLADYGGSLHLNGLSYLSEAKADFLASHAGWLTLDGVTTISDRAAGSLARHRGGPVLLPALQALGDGPGHLSLARSWTTEDEVDLPGLMLLSVAAAQELAGVQGHLRLDGLTWLRSDVATALAGFQGKFLSMNGLWTLSTEAARELSFIACWSLRLEGIRFLTKNAVQQLLRFGGGELCAAPGDEWEFLHQLNTTAALILAVRLDRDVGAAPLLEESDLDNDDEPSDEDVQRADAERSRRWADDERTARLIADFFDSLDSLSRDLLDRALRTYNEPDIAHVQGLDHDELASVLARSVFTTIMNVDSIARDRETHI